MGQVDIKIYKTGTPTGNIWIEIWSDTGSNLPNAKIGSSSANVDVSTLGASPGAFTTFTWGDGPDITAATKYWIVFAGDFTQSNTNNCQWRTDTDASGGGYSGGITAKSDNGSTWSAISDPNDYMFKEYYQAVTIVTLSSGYSFVI